MLSPVNAPKGYRATAAALRPFRLNREGVIEYLTFNNSNRLLLLLLLITLTLTMQLHTAGRVLGRTLHRVLGRTYHAAQRFLRLQA